MKPNLESLSKSSANASVWNLLSHKYSELSRCTSLLSGYPYFDINIDHSRVDCLMRLKIERDLLLLSLVSQDGSYEQDQSVVGDSVVKLETLLSRSDGSQHGKSVHSGLDVGGGTVFLRQHVGELRDLGLRDPQR